MQILFRNHASIATVPKSQKSRKRLQRFPERNWQCNDTRTTECSRLDSTRAQRPLRRAVSARKRATMHSAQKRGQMVSLSLDSGLNEYLKRINMNMKVLNMTTCDWEGVATLQRTYAIIFMLSLNRGYHHCWKPNKSDLEPAHMNRQINSSPLQLISTDMGWQQRNTTCSLLQCLSTATWSRGQHVRPGFVRHTGTYVWTVNPTIHKSHECNVFHPTSWSYRPLQTLNSHS